MLAVRDVDHPKMNRPLPFLCLLLLVGLPPAGRGAAPAESTTTEQAKARLAEVRGRIAALTSSMAAQLKDRDSQAARLREAELSIEAARRRLEVLHGEQAAAERHRGELRTEQMHTQNALDGQRAVLAAEVRAAYMMGRQEPLKLLLNQSDPADVGRVMAFYGYFARARAMKIAAIAARVERVRQLVAEVDDVGAKLHALQAETVEQMRTLQQAHDERRAALDAVNAQVNGSALQLGELKRREQAEEALLADLSRVLKDFPVESPQNFDGLRGRLPWPVSGRLNAGQSGLRRDGVLIDGTRGAKVRAPYFGRVVYADWLQGLGLLLIIGHSGNYMTLYGHAEVLYKSVGDWVAPGDVIASLSEAGGGAPQLYFEIREGRKAVDTKSWLKPAP